jgi:aminoglycoside 6'-N-acetyltransferase
MKTLHTWLNLGNVLQFYAEKPHTLGEIKEKYLPLVRKDSLTKGFIIEMDGIEIGFIKTYFIKDYPDYAKHLDLKGNPAAFDVFIIDEFQGKGIGPKVIRQFIDEKIFVNPKIKEIVIGPNKENHNAIKAYEKIGFKFLKLVKVPEETNEEYLMGLRRKD